MKNNKLTRSPRPPRWTATGITIAAALVVLTIAFAAVMLVGDAHDIESATVPPSADGAAHLVGQVTGAAAAPDGVDVVIVADRAGIDVSEAERQREGTARPGPAPGEGQVIEASGRRAARLWRSSLASASLIVIVAPDADNATALRLPAALRHARDFHVAVVFPECSGDLAQLEGVLDALTSATGAARLATVLVALTNSGVVALRLALVRHDVLALVLIAADKPAEVALPELTPLAGRHVLVVYETTRQGGVAFARHLGVLPLARIDARTLSDAKGRGAAGLIADRRVVSDMLGWLFAVAPALEQPIGQR